MSYDGFYGELSTRASANEIMDIVVAAKDETLAAEASVELLSQQVEVDAAAAEAASESASLSAAASAASAATAASAAVTAVDSAAQAAENGYAAIIPVDSVVGLQTVKRNAVQLVATSGFFGGLYASSTPSKKNNGGGFYKWCALVPKSQHNGGIIISPTVPWNGSQATLAAFLAGTGETSPGGAGCFVRVINGPVTPRWFGAVGDGVVNDYAAVQASVSWAELNGGDWYLDAGSYFTGTSTIVQTRRLKAIGAGCDAAKIVYSGTGSAWRWDVPYAGLSNNGYRWDQFGIEPLVPGAGTYGLHLKLQAAGGGSVSFCADADIINMYFGKFGSAGLYLDNSVANVDGFFTSRIENCVSASPFLLTKIGDSMRVMRNKIYGAGCGITWESVPGARGSELVGNNITSTGGAWALISAEGVLVRSNQCEHPGYISGYTGAFDCAALIYNCYMITLEDNIINPDNGALTAPVSPGMASSSLAIDGTSTQIVIGKNNDFKKGTVFHINIGSITVVDTWIDETNRYYGATPAIGNGGVGTKRVLYGSKSYNPPSLAAGDSTTENITVTDAGLGMFVMPSFSVPLASVNISAWVSAVDTVTVQFSNRTSSTVDLAAGVLNVRVTS